jgi:hypothetical protein
MPESYAYAVGPRPLTGAFYWLPSPSLTWSLLTCHDLALEDGTAHRELWPFVLDHLAAAWGRDPKAFRRCLGDHYYALPRGRVMKPKGQYLILHGNDAPLPGRQAIVVDRFHLHAHQIKAPWDEHERVLRDDGLALEEALGIELDLPYV